MANLKKNFPHVNDMMIEMAVESTNYSLEKSSAILRMLKTDSSGPSKGGASRKCFNACQFTHSMQSNEVTELMKIYKRDYTIVIF